MVKDYGTFFFYDPVLLFLLLASFFDTLKVNSPLSFLGRLSLMVFVQFGFVWFYGTSTNVYYLMPNPLLYLSLSHTHTHTHIYIYDI